MIFNLFGKKEEGDNGRAFRDIVWLDTAAKNNGLLAIYQNEPQTVFIGWFADTITAFKSFLKVSGVDEDCVKDAKAVQRHQVEGRPVILLEHHPMHAKEIALAEALQLQQAVVHGALDEAIFIHFGSEKMMPLIKMLGFKASNPIEHPYVTSSVIKAQDKMAAKVTVEQSALSQAEWLKRNLKEE